MKNGLSLRSIWAYVVSCCSAVAFLVLSQANAMATPATVTIEPAVDMPAAITSLMTAFGLVIVSVLAAFFAILLIRLCVRWIRAYFK